MKIAIADTHTDRIALCNEAIAKTDGNIICWTARSIDEAIKKAALNPPDMILMGLELAEAAIPQIMKEKPCAILLMTLSLSKFSDQVFESMGQGALDVIKVDPETANGKSIALVSLKDKILMTQLLLGTEKKRLRHLKVHAKYEDERCPPLVVIGASTGGPAALATLLDSFPDEVPFSTILVQHVDEKFAIGLANWLTNRSGYSIEIVQNGSRPEKGKVFIASPNDHLILNEHHQLHYTPHPMDNPYRPSIDVFFESLSRHWPVPSIAVLLTGMGNDGAFGLKLLAEAGWLTIAQDEASCVVYGMPKAAIEMGAAKEILPLEEIAPRILEIINGRKS